MLDSPRNIRKVSLDQFDTRDHLRHAARQAKERSYKDFVIVDVDSHIYETAPFAEIVEYIEDPIIQYEARSQGLIGFGIGSVSGFYQSNAGRIIRYPGRAKEKVPESPHPEITLMRRWMDPMGVDYACMFPTPMLTLSLCPRLDVQSQLAWAYNRWLCERVLSQEPRLKAMLYLPFLDPLMCERIVETFSDQPGVVGYVVAAPHKARVYDNCYAPLYTKLQERKMPLAFHAAFNWGDESLELTNRFIGVHALGFVWHNMVHLTNWIVNGVPERFPELKTLWIESGLAWVPFLMQRLDNEYMMRSSDCPILTRKPSDYIRDLFFTSQPMEMVHNREALKLTFDMINAETQLLYASDYPHWDMDLPSTIYDLDFLSEEAKRNILGGNAVRLFNIDTSDRPAKTYENYL
jgi:predicted TIM-barrel fold metal-dependent hydrolase